MLSKVIAWNVWWKKFSVSFVSLHVQNHANSLDKDSPRDYIDVLLSQSNFGQGDEGLLTGKCP